MNLFEGINKINKDNRKINNSDPNDLKLDNSNNNNINNTICCGIVAFVTSYDILDNLKLYYEKVKSSIKINLKDNLYVNNNKKSEENINTLYHTILYKLMFDDIIFEDKTGRLDAFSVHKEKININKKNSILISVIGGKLSEGINFSDDLARCVILFGMPYPNIKSQEIKIKMDYYDKLFKENISSMNGDHYYENLCMKAINQTIGRAIRHKYDYSSIVLVDIRYKSTKIRNKLSKWIMENDIYEFDCEDKILLYEKDLSEFIHSKLN